MLDDISPTTLPRLIRRTILTALVVGTVGFFVALTYNYLAGLGEAIGVILAILNLRYLDKQVANVELKGVH